MIRVTAPRAKGVHLASAEGVSIHLCAGESRPVQPFMAAIAAKNGCAVTPIDEGEETVTAAPEATAGAEPAREEGAADERLVQLEIAVRQMVADGDPKDFTADGSRPKKAAAQLRAGVAFTVEELEAAFARVTA